MLLQKEDLRIEVFINPQLLVDEGRSLAEGTDLFVQSRCLIIVFCVFNLMSQTQIEDQEGERSILDMFHQLL